MDVDGIEHIILEGGKRVLGGVKGVLIEINDDFIEQEQKSKELLKKAGLTLNQKLHSELIENSTTGFSNTYNQIWIRENSS